MMEFLFSFIRFLIVLGIGILLTKFFVDLLEGFLKRKEMLKLIKGMGFDERTVDLVCIFVRYGFYFITFIAALSQFGLAGFVLNILLISIIIIFFIFLVYSMKDVIPNALACIYITRFKSVRKGRWVKVGRYEGRVVRISLLSTTLRDKEGKLIILPNTIFTKKVTVVR